MSAINERRIAGLEQAFMDAGEEARESDRNTKVVTIEGSTVALEVLEQPVPGAERTVLLKEGSSELFHRIGTIPEDSWQDSIAIHQIRPGETGLHPLSWYHAGPETGSTLTTTPDTVARKIDQIHGGLLALVAQRAQNNEMRDRGLLERVMQPAHAEKPALQLV